MFKKYSILLLSLLLIVFISNVAYATDIVDSNSSINRIDPSTLTIDNTIYSDVQDNSNIQDSIDIQDNANITNSNDELPYEEIMPSTTIVEDYDSSGDELSISNIINIILIVVGIVLILLGIAIILKLK